VQTRRSSQLSYWPKKRETIIASALRAVKKVYAPTGRTSTYL